jgi:hypothetical protein
MPACLFLKQYGERRTGTNALRALITANCRDVVVLMHILGDKHSPPVALEELWREVQSSDDPAWQFVSRATFAAPARTTSRDDAGQLAELRRSAEPLTASFVSGAFGWLISIRNPYAWAIGLGRFLGWASRGSFPDTRLEDLRNACRIFNTNYTAWLGLAEARPWRALIVRHEDLVADSEATVRQVESKFGLEPSARFTPVDHVVEPAHWDHVNMPVRRLSYDRDHYAGAAQWRDLPMPHRRVVTETVDWDLLRPLGYAPEP